MNKKSIEEILKSNRKLYIAITGGGTSVIPTLLENGGASEIFLGAIVPYHPDELKDVIGSFDKAVSKKTAMLLSLTAFNKRISDILVDNVECVGIGVTASLAKNGAERAGREHKACIGVSIIKFDKSTKREYLEIIFGEKRTRKEEEDILAELILAMVDMNMCLRKAHHFNNGDSTAKYLKSIGLTENDNVKWEMI